MTPEAVTAGISVRVFTGRQAEGGGILSVLDGNAEIEELLERGRMAEEQELLEHDRLAEEQRIADLRRQRDMEQQRTDALSREHSATTGPTTWRPMPGK